MSGTALSARKPFVIGPTQGRQYDMGRMRAVFFADEAETAGRYSISEWSLEPRTPGAFEHTHPDDHLFYVLAGTVSLLIDGQWSDAARGSYVLIPGGVPHAFENRGGEECRFISINVPAGFEQRMPDIVKGFAEHPLQERDA